VRNEQTTSVVFVGVGGQGVLLACEVTARAAILSGFRVKTNEVHGMAQRGGSVIAQIRYGRDVHSPLVAHGTARVLGSLERIEALRYHQYLAPDGLAVVSSQRIVPTTASSGHAVYPDDVPERLQRVFPRLVFLDAVGEATSLGSPRAATGIVLGALSTELDLPIASWEGALGQSGKAVHRELNLRAFHRGRELAQHDGNPLPAAPSPDPTR
jgi:indolepyruvate ferredoxin oxidoreductase beta subunit